MRCFTVIGPSQSGKSTLVKALGDLEGRSSETTFSEQFSLRTFDYIGERWGAFDIAGGTDILGNAGQAMAASDAVVLCVPPDPDGAPQAAPYLRLIEEADVPSFLFVNRMDAPEGRVRDTVAALQNYANHIIVLRQIPIREGGVVTGAVDLISERAWEYQEGKTSALIEIPDDIRDREQEARSELLEHLADFDDGLLEQLIEDRVPATENVFSLLADIHRASQLVPAYLGSAIQSNGVNRLMKALRHEAGKPEKIAERLGLSADALAIGIFADNRRHVGKSILLRALGGSIQQGSELAGAPIGNLNGSDGKPLADALKPGDLALAVKSDHLDPGAAFSATAQIALPDWCHGHTPAFRRALTPDSERDDARLSTALARLEAVEPGMELSQAEDSGHMVATLQGPMHLRRVLEKLKSEFDISASDHMLTGNYRETISKSVDKRYRHRKQSGGAGQFADVQLVVRPLARGEGFSFDDTVKGGAVPRNFIPSVASGAEEALARGPLGFKVVDVAVTLTDGKHHSVDSSDYAFRTAGLMGVREALQEASPVLLQPIDQVEIHVPSVYAGALVALISSLKGQVQGFRSASLCQGLGYFPGADPFGCAGRTFCLARRAYPRYRMV